MINSLIGRYTFKSSKKINYYSCSKKYSNDGDKNYNDSVNTR